MVRKRRSFFDDFFGSNFDIDEIMERMLKDLQEGQTYQPFIYGFSVTQHPGEEPEIREFGNIQPVGRKVRMEEERKPLVDVIETENQICVIAEIPGVSKEDIRVDATPNKLDISAQNTLRKYSESIELPAKVDPQSAVASYKNGVLEVKLNRVEPEEKKSHVKVE
ncbi:MAG TPA: archaeal heat shock protein Hsp20 [Candidatus Acidoferrum sp.]|nr:archaeal heat shock protein Hsp20 [Candidatus Acidoferrum sp.]